MKIFLLEHKYEVAGYDIAKGHVVRANDEAEAREIASCCAGDEGSGLWKSKSKTTCVVIGVADKDSEAGHILRDFENG